MIFKADKVNTEIILIAILPILLLFSLFHSGIKEAVSTSYSGDLRLAFFSGFLSVGAFLLSLKTFILVHLYDRVYKDEDYQKKVIALRNQGNEASFFGPLERLARLLSASVVFCFVTSCAQVSIGFIPHAVTIGICICMAISSVALVLDCWWRISSNLKLWFRKEEEALATKYPCKTRKGPLEIPIKRESNCENH